VLVTTFDKSLELAEGFFKTSASWLALIVEIVACLIIAAAMIEAATATFPPTGRSELTDSDLNKRKLVLFILKRENHADIKN